MGRNALGTDSDSRSRRRTADVSRTDHPLALVDDRQPADLRLCHVPYRLGEVLVLPAAMYARGHHLPRRRAADIKAILRQAFAGDVAVGHRPTGLPLQSERRLCQPERKSIGAALSA
jgi:hypothetical protein